MEIEGTTRAISKSDPDEVVALSLTGIIVELKLQPLRFARFDGSLIDVINKARVSRNDSGSLFGIRWEVELLIQFYFFQITIRAYGPGKFYRRENRWLSTIVGKLPLNFCGLHAYRSKLNALCSEKLDRIHIIWVVSLTCNA